MTMMLAHAITLSFECKGKDTIEVANLETRTRRVLVEEGLLQPRGITLHPGIGKIFWSDRDRSLQPNCFPCTNRVTKKWPGENMHAGWPSKFASKLNRRLKKLKETRLFINPDTLL